MLRTRRSLAALLLVLAAVLFFSSTIQAQERTQHHFYRIYRVADDMYPKNVADHRAYAIKVDSVLNVIYNRILDDYKEDTLFVHNLRESERAWIAFRDASIAAIMPAKDTSDDATKAQCRAEYFSAITRRRIEELNLWYTGRALHEAGGFGYISDNLCSSYHTETAQQRLHSK